MVSLSKRNKGFTIVELLIVIVVIGILALLVITTYSGIQQKARNSKRASDMKSLQTNIEAYFTQSSHYPSLADMNTASFLTTNMKSLDQNALIDPLNPTQSKALVASPVAKSYAFQPKQSDGSTSCESDDTTCVVYTLTATYEGQYNGTGTYIAKNLN